jgi:hypothetical protein
MFNLKTTTATVAIALVLVLASCSSTPVDSSKPYVKTKPIYAMNKAEKKRYFDNLYEGRADEAVEAACVFGSSPIFDRKKMGCEKVKDSPEWEALQEKKAEAQRIRDEESIF